MNDLTVTLDTGAHRDVHEEPEATARGCALIGCTALGVHSGLGWQGRQCCGTLSP